MFPGETIATGAATTCDQCGESPTIGVYSSGGGHYVGTWCQCGPYTRESAYYPTRELAQSALDSKTYGR